MNRRPVQSSNISGIGWEPSGENSPTGTLEVAFKSGHVYEYADVPEQEYLAFLGASSIGKYFAANIQGKFEHTRLK